MGNVKQPYISMLRKIFFMLIVIKKIKVFIAINDIIHILRDNLRVSKDEIVFNIK